MYDLWDQPPATYVNEFLYFTCELRLKEDKWVSQKKKTIFFRNPLMELSEASYSDRQGEIVLQNNVPCGIWNLRTRR